MPKDIITDDQVEREIARLLESPYGEAGEKGRTDPAAAAQVHV